MTYHATSMTRRTVRSQFKQRSESHACGEPVVVEEEEEEVEGATEGRLHPNRCTLPVLLVNTGAIKRLVHFRIALAAAPDRGSLLLLIVVLLLLLPQLVLLLLPCFIPLDDFNDPLISEDDAEM